jgi:hypothetical protein
MTLGIDPTSRVSTYTWNPTMGSYVQAHLETADKAGQQTGVTKFSHTVTAARNGWRISATASDTGRQTIKRFVAAALADPTLWTPQHPATVHPWT